VDPTEDVDPPGGGEVPVGELRERSRAGSGARVVDEYVHGPELATHALDDGGSRLAVCDVEAERDRPSAARTYEPGGSFEDRGSR
jgi:hypothetical protein